MSKSIARSTNMQARKIKLMNDIVDYIDLRFNEDNIVPTMEDMAEHFGVTKQCICLNIKTMVEIGLVERSGGARAIITPNMKKTSKDTVNVPLVGSVACGTPVLAEENIETVVAFPRELIGPGNFYLLRAYGDSMIDAGIEEGDLVLVRNTQDAQDGQIVVALVDNESTLKRIFIDDKHKKIILHPENKNMRDMVFDEVTIQGVAVKVLKNL